MPEVCRFYGIVISIYYNDHGPLAAILNSGLLGPLPEEWIPWAGSSRWTEFAAKMYLGKIARPSLNIAAILSVDWVYLNGLPGRLRKGVAVSF